jgi:hypothetical protein
MYVATQVHFVHYIIVTNPRIVPEFIIHPGHGGEPRVDKQYVHILWVTSTHVFFVRFGSKCHNTAAENGTLRNGTLQNGKLQNGSLQNGMLQSCKLQNSTALKNGTDTKWYKVLKHYMLQNDLLQKWNCYKTVHYKIRSQTLWLVTYQHITVIIT